MCSFKAIKESYKTNIHLFFQKSILKWTGSSRWKMEEWFRPLDFIHTMWVKSKRFICSCNTWSDWRPWCSNRQVTMPTKLTLPLWVYYQLENHIVKTQRVLDRHKSRKLNKFKVQQGVLAQQWRQLGRKQTIIKSPKVYLLARKLAYLIV